MTKYYIINGIPQTFEYPNEEEGINLTLYPDAVELTQEQYETHLEQINAATSLREAQNNKIRSLYSELKEVVDGGFTHISSGKVFKADKEAYEAFTALKAHLLSLPTDTVFNLLFTKAGEQLSWEAGDIISMLTEYGTWYGTNVWYFEKGVIPAIIAQINACETVEEVNAITW
jgi:hypothetical protein